MKKTLSLVLAVLTMLSVFSLTAFAADAPAITGVSCTYDGVKVTWGASEGATAYLVYRDGVCIATVLETQYTDETVAAGKSYNYSVVAQLKDGSLSDVSSDYNITYNRPYCAHKKYSWVEDYPATVYGAGLKHKHCNTCGLDFGNTAIKQLAPEAPAISSIAVQNGYVAVKWGVVDGADYYQVYRIAAGEKAYTYLGSVKTTAFYDKTAKSGVTYTYGVRAVNEAGKSAYNGKADGKSTSYIATPTVLAVANTAAGIRFTWNKIAGAESYRVYRKELGNEEWTYLGAVKTTAYGDLECIPGVDYVYTVIAVGKGARSKFVSSEAIRRLEVPELLKATNTSEGLQIQWAEVEGASGYYVYRKTSKGWALVGTVRNARSTSYLVLDSVNGGVVNAAVNTYTVRAFYKPIKGDQLSTSSFDANGIKYMRLQEPDVKSAKSTASGVKVTWDTVEGAKGYVVYSRTAGGKWKKLATVTGASYTDKTAKKGTTYTYTVRAINGGYISSFEKGVTVKDIY